MSAARQTLFGLARAANEGRRAGLVSVCSAHPLVIEAALAEARDAGAVACIEATCNQVNQEGGYTGQTPAAFRDGVERLAAQVGLPMERLLLGGDHLGPNPWRHLAAGTAMDRAEAMTRAYAAAGFQKIHLDASMACADDPGPLAPAVIAERAARLCAAAEAGAAEGGYPPPGYIVGTEVPVPGGAAEAMESVQVTRPGDAEATLALHRDAFAARGVQAATDRVVALVVQPGVEFGQTEVIRYDPAAADDLIAWRQGREVVFEAHSTDYQTPEALAALVEGGFSILKVGPGLTFALREALYALDRDGALRATMERLMLAEPGHWRPYVHGTEKDHSRQRHEGLSDRIRYYWTHPEAEAAVRELLRQAGARDRIQSAVRAALAPYRQAVSPG